MRGATEMRKKLVRHGNSRALVIDRALIELLGLGEDDEVEISVQDQTLVVRPASTESERDEAFDRALHESVAQYSDVYKRLAE